MSRDDNPTRKGKAKAASEELSNDASESNDQSNLGSRIADSATGLLREIVGSTADVPGVLAATIAGSKASSSATTSTATSNLERSQAHNPVPVISNTASRNTDIAGESIRTKSSLDEVERDFYEFSLGQQLHSAGEDHAIHPFEASWQAAVAEQRINHEDVTPTSRVDAYDDGAEVRALLADPNFDADMHDNTGQFHAAPEPSAQDLFSQDFSAEEQSAINELRGTLPAPPVHLSMPVNHPLSLVPRSDEEKATIEENIDDILMGNFTASMLSLQSIDETTAADDLHEANWVRLLYRYTDEVWGDMWPEVQQTRAEFRDKFEQKETIDSKAVARLKMIIGHLDPNRF